MGPRPTQRDEDAIAGRFIDGQSIEPRCRNAQDRIQSWIDAVHIILECQSHLDVWY